MFGPYYRVGDPPDVLRKIVESGELWGASPQHIFRSDTPKVKAFAGNLPKGVQGFEFETPVAPDAGCVPGKPTWSDGRPGVVVKGGYARIEVHVLKEVVLS